MRDFKKSKRIVGVLTDGQLTSLKAKMAHGIIRYCDDIVVVIDAVYAGNSLCDLVPYTNKNVPIVQDIHEAIRYDINELIIGISPPGGGLPDSFISTIETALNHNIKVVNGLHIRLEHIPQFSNFATRGQLEDIRYSSQPTEVGKGKAAELNKNVILTVGSDCASGKMTTALELYHGALKRSLNADFIATGQTGVCIKGNGIAIDAVIADFLSGAVESMVINSATHHDFIFVEGQGSILHPAYSGVALGLLHGSAPNIVIFSHDYDRSSLAYFDRKIESMHEQIELTERLASHQRECHVLGISLMVKERDPYRLKRVLLEMEREFRIPVFAPLGGGVDKMIEVLTDYS